MRAHWQAQRDKAAWVGCAVRFMWLGVCLALLIWSMPEMHTEKVNINNLRGAAKHQARVWTKGVVK